MSDRIQCSHCPNPNQGVSRCRYLWYTGITRERWAMGGCDLPCVESPDSSDAQLRDYQDVLTLRRKRTKIALRVLAIAAVVVLALYLRGH